MLDTVGSDKHKQTFLQGISNKAKLNKRHRFQNLYRCLNEELLLNCWSNLNKDASSGVDGVTWQMYAKDLQANVKALVSRLKAKQYRAKLVLRRYIPKDRDKVRALGIPVIEDKLVQAGCAKVLMAIYEQDFLPVSYGYRPNRSAQDAVFDLTFDLQYGCYGYVVEADIKGFFKVLPLRLRRFKLEIAPSKTRLVRFSRFHPSMQRGFGYLGFDFNWTPDRQGVPCVKRRTSAKKQQAACRKIKLWIKFNRHLPKHDFFKGLNRRLQGHYNDYGVRGNSRRLDRFYWWAMNSVFKWLNRRGGKRTSYTWDQFLSLLPLVPIARPCITEVRRQRVYA